MQKSFFRAKQPGQSRAQKKSPAQAMPGQRRHKKKVRRKRDAWPAPTQINRVRRKRYAWPGT